MIFLVGRLGCNGGMPEAHVWAGEWEGTAMACHCSGCRI